MFCEACGGELEEDDVFCSRCGCATKNATAARAPRVCARQREGRVVAGVCAGWARYFGKDVTVIRILCVILALIPPLFPGATAYVVSWLLMPQSNAAAPPSAASEDAVGSE